MKKYHIFVSAILLLITNAVSASSTQLYKCSAGLTANPPSIIGNKESPYMRDFSHCVKLLEVPTRKEHLALKDSVGKMKDELTSTLEKNNIETKTLILDSIEELSSTIITEEIESSLENKITHKLLQKINELQQQVIELQKKVN